MIQELTEALLDVGLEIPHWTSYPAALCDTLCVGGFECKWEATLTLVLVPLLILAEMMPLPCPCRRPQDRTSREGVWETACASGLQVDTEVSQSSIGN